MSNIIKDNSNKIIKENKTTKSQLSIYNLYTINGCSQTNIEIQKPIYIGSYH